MAKKSTWEKRAKKVKKEEYLVLGGKGGKKGPSKSTVKGKKEEDPATGPGAKKGPGSRTRRESKPADGSPGTRGGNKKSYEATKFKGAPKSRGSKFDPTEFITRDDDEGSNDRFKNRGNANKQFRQGDKKKSYGKFTKDKPFSGFQKKKVIADDGLTRLNKYLSMAGICSRREADKFIEQGLVSVNGQVITQLGTKVKPTDVVEYAGEKVKAEAMRYILLNKPKDCITTLSDERGRSTVIGLVKNACKERIFPVGRLDRNTTGLLLLTNDGDLADKLAHPSNEVRKVYHVITDKNVSVADLKKLETGVELDDGMAKADAALFAGDGSVRNEIGLEIHSGKNRVVRRMFEALGYDVTKLDRAAFAGLSKKGLPRGRWRFLTEKEVSYLRML